MTANDPSEGPLHAIKVLDLTTTLMGPYCTMLMARMGADVLKVESPEGDIVRQIGGGHHPSMGPIFLQLNHGKRSIALDLKQPKAVSLLLELVAQSDVFITNVRPAALRTLGLDRQAVNSANPRAVYCMLTGFGADGAYGDLAAYDDVIQAISGLAAVQGGDGAPTYVRAPVADKATGLLALGAVVSALLQRERTGRGCVVEVPMFESMTSFNLVEQLGGHTFDPPTGPVGYARTSSPHRRPYRTADGYLGVVVYTDRQWQQFFDLIGRPGLAATGKFHTIRQRTENIDELYAIVQESLLERTSEEWLTDLRRLDIPAVRVLTVDELLQDPHLAMVAFFESIDHPSEGPLLLPRLPIAFSEGGRAPVLRPAPRLGEHSEEVLTALGYGREAIDNLIEARVAITPDS